MSFAGWVAMSLEPLIQPDLLAALRTGQPFDSIGCRFVARGGKLSSPVIQVVWVRNFAGSELSGILSPELSISTGVNPLRVAENVAWYFGQTRALELKRGRPYAVTVRGQREEKKGGPNQAASPAAAAVKPLARRPPRR